MHNYIKVADCLLQEGVEVDASYLVAPCNSSVIFLSQKCLFTICNDISI